MLALEAGAALADLEFMQFHPTALRAEGELDGFLVTEAVRGEGALIVDSGGERFVDELAPRDEVARAIDARLRAGDDGVPRHARHRREPLPEHRGEARPGRARSRAATRSRSRPPPTT